MNKFEKIAGMLVALSLLACSTLFLFILSFDTLKAQFTGNENHQISLDQGVRFVDNFKANPTAPSTKGGYFGRNIFEKILAQPGCIGIRYYYAKLDDGSPTLVLVGVEGNGNDMEQGVIGEIVNPCPPFCGTSGQLNK